MHSEANDTESLQCPPPCMTQDLRNDETYHLHAKEGLGALTSLKRLYRMTQYDIQQAKNVDMLRDTNIQVMRRWAEETKNNRNKPAMKESIDKIKLM